MTFGEIVLTLATCVAMVNTINCGWVYVFPILDTNLWHGRSSFLANTVTLENSKFYSNSNSVHYCRLFTNISSVVEFQRWWVLKSKLFGQESTCHQGKIFKKILRVMTVCQKVPKSYFQSQFWMSKINRIFSKKKFI